jgi:hypothetical protein
VRWVYLQELKSATAPEFEAILTGLNETYRLTPPAAEWLAREMLRPRKSLGGKTLADGLVFNNCTRRMETIEEVLERDGGIAEVKTECDTPRRALYEGEKVPPPGAENSGERKVPTAS